MIDHLNETPLREVVDRFAPQLALAEEQLGEVNERVKHFVKKNPGAVLLGAAAIGFALGRLAAHR